MQFQQLFVFCKVVEKNSFSKAAEDLFLSQSTVSNHIGNLESYFDQKLFDRLSKEIVLTPFGQKLYPWALEIINLRKMAIWDLREWTGKIQGKLCIAASTVPAEYMVPLLVSNFRKIYPEVQFTLTQHNSEAVAEALLKGAAEIGILGEKYYPEKIAYIPFTNERLVLITPTELKLEEPVTINALTDLPFIVRTPGSGTQSTVQKILTKYGIHISILKIVAYFDSVQAVKQSVKAGLGVSIISEIAAADYVKYNLVNSYHLNDLAEKRAFYLAFNNQLTLSPLNKKFVELSLTAKDQFII